MASSQAAMASSCEAGRSSRNWLRYWMNSPCRRLNTSERTSSTEAPRSMGWLSKSRRRTSRFSSVRSRESTARYIGKAMRSSTGWG